MRQVGLEDAAAQFVWGGSNLVDRVDDLVHQLVPVERAAVGEFSLGQRPNAFVGVEFRGVSRKVLDLEARVPTQEPLQRCAVVRRGIVEQNDDGTPEMPQQFAEKETDFFLADVVEEKQIVEAQVLSSGADRDSGDDGDFVPASLAMTHEGGQALGRPSPGHQGSQQEARFVGKNQVGAQPLSVFFTRGQSFCFQRSMASWSRSMARVSGF